jgi:hypothetical protein
MATTNRAETRGLSVDLELARGEREIRRLRARMRRLDRTKSLRRWLRQAFVVAVPRAA